MSFLLSIIEVFLEIASSKYLINYIPGARWDTQTGMITDARLKELTPTMPVIFIKVHICFFPLLYVTLHLLEYIGLTFCIKSNTRQYQWTSRKLGTFMSVQFTKPKREVLLSFGLSTCAARISPQSGLWVVLLCF